MINYYIATAMYVCVLHMHDYFRSVTGYDALTSFTPLLYVCTYIHIILLRHAMNGIYMCI